MGKVDIAVTNSETATEGGTAGWYRTGGAANCGPAAGLLVFLVGAALLALVGLVAEGGVVETQTVVEAALGVGERRRPDLSPLGVLRRYGEGDLLSFGRVECCHGPAAAAAEAASSGVWDIQSALQRWIISSVVSKDHVLIRALMWRGS